MRGFVLMLALAAPLLLAPAAAGATEPQTGGGGFAVTAAVVTSSRMADGNTVLTIDVTTALTGTFDGTQVSEEQAVVHPDGEITARAVETFTGTVNGVAGTAVFRTEGTIDAVTGSLSGQFTVGDGTGGLADFHGHGTIAGTGDAGTYEVEFHFDPAP